MRRASDGRGVIFYPPRRRKAHLWRTVEGWWVFDPINVLPLGPYSWSHVVLEARSVARQLRETSS